MSDVVVSWTKHFRRNTPRPVREEILAQHSTIASVVAQIAAVPASHRTDLYFHAVWCTAAKYLETPDATTPDERARLLKNLSELCGVPHANATRDMGDMVNKLDADHR